MDPSLSCTFANDNTNNPPNWRWCAFGLMQVTDPPYTYWPASLSPTGVDGTHWATTQELLSRPVSQVTMGGMAASKAACGDHFNPFNITDNLCWGTAKLSANLDQGRAAVDHYRDQGLIDWPADTLEGAEKDRVFAAYIAANKYSGTWDQHFISSSVCGTMTDGDCLMKLYHDRRIVTPDFCTPSRGGVLITPDCFANGIPRDEAHGGCYGYQDPVRLMTCLLHLYGAPHYQWDRGAGKMARYYYFRNNCANSNCPATRQLLVATGHSDLTNSGTFNPQDSIDGSTLPPPSGH